MAGELFRSRINPNFSGSNQAFANAARSIESSQKGLASINAQMQEARNAQLEQNAVMQQQANFERQQNFRENEGQRAVVEEQRIFDLEKQRGIDKNLAMSNLIQQAKDMQPSFEMEQGTKQAIFNSPGYQTQTSGTRTISDGGRNTSINLNQVDGYKRKDDLMDGFIQNMIDNPRLYQDPAKIKSDVAALAREAGLSETEIAQMQQTATENYSVLDVKSQERLSKNAENRLNFAGKIFSNSGNSNTTNIGTNAFKTGSISQKENADAFKDISETLNVPQSKGAIKWISEALTPETFFGLFPLNSPDMSIDDLQTIVAASQSQSKVGPAATIRAMRALKLINGDGTFSKDISDMMSNDDTMAAIALGAQQNQEASSSRKIGGSESNDQKFQQQQSLYNSLISQYDDSINKILKNSIQQATTSEERQKQAQKFIEEQTGVSRDFKLGGNKPKTKPKIKLKPIISEDEIDTSDDVEEPVEAPISTKERDITPAENRILSGPGNTYTPELKTKEITTKAKELEARAKVKSQKVAADKRGFIAIALDPNSTEAEKAAAQKGLSEVDAKNPKYKDTSIFNYSAGDRPERTNPNGTDFRLQNFNFEQAQEKAEKTASNVKLQKLRDLKSKVDEDKIKQLLEALRTGDQKLKDFKPKSGAEKQQAEYLKLLLEEQGK